MLTNNRWQRNGDEIAIRIEARDVRGSWLLKDLVVEEGQNLLLMIDGVLETTRAPVNGQPSQVLGPGPYLMADLGDRMATAIGLRSYDRVSAVLLLAESFDLVFAFDALFTTDPLRVGMRVRLRARVVDPVLFLRAFMRSQQRVTETLLADYLRDEVAAVAGAWIGARSVAQLGSDPQSRAELELALQNALEETTYSLGILVDNLRSFDYVTTFYNQQRAAQEELLILRSEGDTKLARTKLLHEQKTAQELEQIAAETAEVELYEKRMAVRERMRRAVNSAEFAELTDQQARERFLRAIDRQKLIDDDEWDRFKRTLQWRRDRELQDQMHALEDAAWQHTVALEDRDRDRAQLLARINIENKYDLQRLEAEREFARRRYELTQNQSLEPDELEHQIRMARAQLNGQIELALAQQAGEQAIAAQKQAFELAEAAKLAEARRAEEEHKAATERVRIIADEQTRVAVALSAARTAAEIDRLEREQDRLDLEMSFWSLREVKAIRAEAELKSEQNRLIILREELEIQIKAEERRLQMELERMLAEADIRRADKAQDQQHELNWMKALADLEPVQLVVAARDSERAQIIKDMQQTEAMKGMGEQQILAMLAGNSPHAADALKEIARAGAEGRLGDEQRALYERLMEQQSKLADFRQQEIERMERQRREDRLDRENEREAQRRMQETTLRGMADIESARAKQSPQSPPNIIVTGSGTPTYYSTPGAAGQSAESGALRCPKCAEVVRADANFCPNCRHQLRGVS